ncbi:ATP-binding protein [bacterium]|nr:ATP-binding protein [bacterium]
MHTVFDCCEPRDEVLRGELKDEIFAARLADVVSGKAEDVYGDATQYFENTYPTSGLKELLQEAIGRLSGARPNASPIIRLETSFGGGKTHNLIGLYHLTKNHVNAELTRKFIDPCLIPSERIEQVAAVVGSDMDPENGFEHEGLTTHTLWGEVAYQLGGKDAYEVLRASDEKRIAPGSQIWDKIVGKKPALIMLDEFARYLRGAKGQVGETSLAEQTVGFLMSLLEFASSRERVVVVLSPATSADAFSKETDSFTQAIAEARRITSRQEHVLTPTSEVEIAAIVSHRLFKRIDHNAGRKVATTYAAFAKHLIQRSEDLPERVARSEYVEEMINSYPFHPELLNTLSRKTATIQNFQKTRGALRLLAMVVRQLWRQDTRDRNVFMIHPFHVDLSVTSIVNDLTSRLERPGYRSVIEADIANPKKGARCHADEIDTKFVESGKPRYAYRIAATVLLHSLNMGAASGVAPEDLWAGVIQPGDDPGLIMKAVNQLVDTCWFLEYDGRRYRFKTEPSINKLIADEMSIVGLIRAKDELDQRIRKVWRKGALEPVYFPDDASYIDDNAKSPKLAIIHYAAATTEATKEVPPDLVVQFFESAGSLHKNRTYKNNVLFLVADEGHVERMTQRSQRLLAIERILTDTDRLAEFSDELKKRLRKKEAEAHLDLLIAITRAYSFLYFPSGDASQRAGRLNRVKLPPQDQGKAPRDQTPVVLQMLVNEGKVLTADDKPLNPAFVKARAWDAEAQTMTTEDIRKSFATKIRLKMVLDPNQLKKTIREGVRNGTWIYYDAKKEIGYGRRSRPLSPELSDDAVLLTLDEAQRRDIHIDGEKVGPEVCPLCGSDPCTCGDEGIEDTREISGEGPPRQAFRAIIDRCHDNKVIRLRCLTVKIDSFGRQALDDTRRLGLAIPQMGRGKYWMNHRMTAEFIVGDQKEAFEVKSSLSWDRYRRFKDIADAFGREASNVEVKTSVAAVFDEGLEVAGDQFETITTVFENLQLGKIKVEAEPEDVEKGSGK